MYQLNGRKRGGGNEMAMPNIRISHPDWQRESLCQMDQKSNNTIFDKLSSRYYYNMAKA
jgi:hypothetical protein